MPKQSAGLLIYRVIDKTLEIFLVHPGGPFWLKKDAGAWSIPKGEADEGEDLLQAAIREMKEETGILTSGPFLPLEPVRQKSGKWVHAWATEQDIDPFSVISNHFETEWPPHSGKIKSFPEIDRAAWFSTAEARNKIIAAQAGFIGQLEKLKGFASDR